MPNEHPLDRAFEELNRVIKKLEKHSKDPQPTHIDPSVLDMLDKVSAEVDQFEKETKILNEQLGLDEERVKKILRSPPKDATQKHRDWIDTSIKARKDVDRIQEDYASNPAPQGQSPMDLLKKKEKKSEKSKAEKTRMNKFRRMGGNSDWRPL